MNYGGGGYEAYGNEDYGGGGFMGSSSQGASQSQGGGGGRGGGGGGRSRDLQTLLPLTVRQLTNRSDGDDAIRVDGQDVTSVKLIGIVGNVMPHSTNVNFQLDDGTGIIEARMFLPSDEDADEGSEIAKLQDGMYVRVVGNVRTFQDKLSLTCHSVVPVQDFNEITHHFLHATYVHCYNTKGRLQGADGGGKQAGATGDFPMQSNQPWNMQGNNNYLTAGGNADTSMDYSMMDANFTPEQKAILDVLGTCTSDHGLKIDQIFQQLRGQMSEDQLRGVLNYLTSEGHVYSTIDENHFKRTT
ncbi:TPA: hypothetical protein N0F65_013043 [Lagenidium giganteum]|uniref:Replication protein A 32 kDa subunit n=1 Tax=Lagenidium giganteum TaxID=4803 RepID=A0AAV2YPB8_9STRA|nr:TPA: hypothetical protein N0F65_013043 [Lagenidium giganteum]